MESRVIFFLAMASSLGFAQTSNLEQIEKEFSNNSEKIVLKNDSVQLSLQDAIEGGLRENYAQKARKYEFQLNEISYKDAYQDFYFPNINLTMNTTSDHFVENFYKDVDVNASSSKVPSGYIGVEVEDYTLFNWGKDYLDYLNQKEIYDNTKTNLTIDKRNLRLDIIKLYFNLAMQKEIVRIYKKQLSHSSFIYRLAKEKLTLKKIKTQEFYEAKSLFLGAHRDYHQSLYEYDQLQEQMIEILGEDNDSAYNPVSVLKFKPLSVTQEESLKFSLQAARDLVNAKAQMNIASRKYEKSQKENLPLPKFTVKLGSYRRNFASGGYSDDYETFSNSKNIELAASVNMSWRLYGSGGFLNTRIQESAYYNKKISELNLRNAHREIKYTNRILHSKIERLERRYKALESQRKNARDVFDQTIDNYISSKTKITNLRQMLKELKDASIDFEITKYNHLAEKVELAKIMGLDDFPGEKFERLVEK